jgi:Protein of unknown function (DUF2585)
MGISRKYWLGVAGMFVLAIAILLAMGRPPICTCGYVKFWEGTVASAGNSQHIADWYSFSHVIHGFLFFGLTGWLMRTRPLGLRLMIATLLELSWELLENSPIIIDGSWMMIGFIAASRLPWKVTAGLALAFELFTLFMIRDNLTLNIVMLVSPIDAVRTWQGTL